MPREEEFYEKIKTQRIVLVGGARRASERRQPLCWVLKKDFHKW